MAPTTRGTVGQPEISAGLAMELVVDFYGLRVSVLTDHAGLAEQICVCFGRMVFAGDLVSATVGADIRVTQVRPGASELTLEQAWSRFSSRFVEVVAHRFLFLHGAAVVPPPRGGPAEVAAFLGPSRSGKTTLCLAAAALGCQVLADDVVALEWESGLVFAVPSPLRPRPDAVRASERYPYVGSPGLTDPVSAPALKRVVLLGQSGASPIKTTALLEALHRPQAVPFQELVTRLLRGFRHATILQAPILPPIAASLTPQMGVVARLLGISPGESSEP